IGLGLSSAAPARWRLAIASSGLLAWVIPWPAIVLPMLSPREALAAGLSPYDFPIDPIEPPAYVASPLPAAHPELTWLQVTLLLVALAGMAILVADVIRYQRTVTRWRRDSVSGEHLRTLLPPSMRTVPWAIRIVPRSRTAAATGLRRGTLWI